MFLAHLRCTKGHGRPDLMRCERELEDFPNLCPILSIFTFLREFSEFWPKERHFEQKSLVSFWHRFIDFA